MKQSVLTIAADVDPNGLEAVRAAIAVVHDDPAGNALLPFAQFDTLHFASLVLAEPPWLDRAKLIFECNVDGTVDVWLATLAGGAGAGLDALFAGSPGYPGSADSARLQSWLASHVVLPRAFHIGATGRSLERIRKEAELHQAIDAFLDEQDAAGALGGAAPASVRTSVQQMVRSDPTLRWAQERPGPRQTAWERASHVSRAVVTAMVVFALLPVLLPLALVALPVLLVKELTDPVQQEPPPPAHVRDVEQDEDQDLVAQNHLSSLIPVKPGILRTTLLPVVLYFVNLLARISATHGTLSGIPSIHFAHWSLIDGHLLFVSNFDGSWESYLGDFIDKAARGLTAVWSNTVNFPRTTLLVLRGAADGPRFRQWARANQCRTGAWYTAYPTASMTIVDNNSTIREELFADLEPDEVVKWLRRL